MKNILVQIFLIILSINVYAQNSNDNRPLKENQEGSLLKLTQSIRPDFYIGSFAAGLNPSKENFQSEAAFFKKNFNIMTAGVYMSSTQRDSGKYNFDLLDKLIDFAVANKLHVYLHPLIGGAQYCPKWFNKGNFSKEELHKIMLERITTIMARYKGKFQYVDVVNEALDAGMTADGQFTWLKNPRQGEHKWMNIMGIYQGKKYQFPQYLVEAYRIAREVGGKEIKLIINDNCNAMAKSLKGMSFFSLVKAMQEEGIPLDGAGIQLHCWIKDGKLYEGGNVPFDFGDFDTMLKLYEQAGIEVHITEFDIHLPQNPTAGDYQLQGKYYAEMLKHAVQSKAVKTFKTWGFTDAESWHPDGKDGHPLLLDEKMNPKPAYLEQIEMLKSLIKIKK